MFLFPIFDQNFGWMQGMRFYGPQGREMPGRIILYIIYRACKTRINKRPHHDCQSDSHKFCVSLMSSIGHRVQLTTVKLKDFFFFIFLRHDVLTKHSCYCTHLILSYEQQMPERHDEPVCMCAPISVIVVRLCILLISKF